MPISKAKQQRRAALVKANATNPNHSKSENSFNQNLVDSQLEISGTSQSDHTPEDLIADNEPTDTTPDDLEVSNTSSETEPSSDPEFTPIFQNVISMQFLSEALLPMVYPNNSFKGYCKSATLVQMLKA